MLECPHDIKWSIHHEAVTASARVGMTWRILVASALEWPVLCMDQDQRRPIQGGKP
jgi:hypothetical protein